jgi:CRP-like cAMP-binding protein
MTTNSIVDVLRTVTVLQQLDEAELKELAPFFSERKAKIGEIICHEGEVSTEFYVLTSGFADVVTTRGGQQNFISTLSSGTYFGESVLFQDMKRIAQVVAASDATLLVIDRAHFHQFIKKCPSGGCHVLLQMLKEVFERLGKMVQEAHSTDAPGLSQEEIDKLLR